MVECFLRELWNCHLFQKSDFFWPGFARDSGQRITFFGKAASSQGTKRQKFDTNKHLNKPFPILAIRKIQYAPEIRGPQPQAEAKNWFVNLQKVYKNHKLKIHFSSFHTNIFIQRQTFKSGSNAG